jgi:hypothetical protein
MLGLYILAAIMGGGLLVFSMLSGAHHDASDVDVAGLDTDVSGLDVDVSGVDVDVSGIDVDVAGADLAGADAHLPVHAGHDVDVGHAGPGELVLGLFKPRNIIFFLTAFGLTGTLLTLTGNPESATLIFALAMGGGAGLLTHAIFLWLRRSEIGVDTVSEGEIEGRAARVVLPLAPDRPGRICCLVGDQEQYVTARLAPDVESPLAVGSEVVILRVENGIAEVIPFDTLELPPSER